MPGFLVPRVYERKQVDGCLVLPNGLTSSKGIEIAPGQAG
jgi:hypothetical protein